MLILSGNSYCISLLPLRLWVFICRYTIFHFERGLSISKCKFVDQYQHFMYNIKLALKTFEINP